jgi:adenylosuccinate synthase
VGTGPFPTEIEGDIADQLRGKRGELGAEFGTVTGRQRRMGWLDGVLVRYAARLNSLTDVFLTKFDKLSGVGPLKIAMAYSYEGDVYDEFPPHQSIFHKCEPIYEDLEGWDEDISAARAFAELPLAAQRYIRRVEEIAGVPVTWISVGPEREQLISTSTVAV